jgi:hypothetical protein
MYNQNSLVTGAKMKFLAPVTNYLASESYQSRSPPNIIKKINNLRYHIIRRPEYGTTVYFEKSLNTRLFSIGVR